MARWCLAAVLVCAALTLAHSAGVGVGAEAPASRFPDMQGASSAEVDEMVGNLLQWIQGLYQQRTRKARQYFGGKPERPRPFEPPATYLPPVTGYPLPGSKPTPAYNEGPSNPSYQPSPSDTTFSPQPNQPEQTYQPTQPAYQPSQPSSPAPTPFQPSPSTPSYRPNQPGFQPSQPTYQPSQPSQPSYVPPQPSYQPPLSSQPGYPSSQPSSPAYQPDEPSSGGYQPSSPGYQPSAPSQPGYQPVPTTPSYQPGQTEETTEYIVAIGESSGTSGSFINTDIQTPVPDDEDRHPPHIHALTVDCGKEMMTINVEFNKPYNGIIYSQEHYSEPSCVYVRANSNQLKYSFTVSLNTCGTRFYSDFQNEGQAYLENVLVLQNEPGIQEVWDHIRRVRCLWEGNLTKQLVSSLSVGMLNQITSNFSGDTAMARLDIQTGRGPFAPEANGLVKIGQLMTLVVTVTGDAGFDIVVRECVARDADGRQVVPLTDSNGCVLKPKLFGAFQKTRDTGNTGASVLAYAYFNAFKFPDEMDLVIQCDVELCKANCDACPNPGSLEPTRRRRDVIHVGNRTVEPSTTIGKGLRVVLPDDLPEPAGLCMTPSAALWGGALLMLGSLLSSVTVSYCWQRSRESNKFS